MQLNDHQYFAGKIVEEYRNNPKIGIQKLREKIQAMTESGQLNLLNNKTNQEIAKLALNLKTVFKDAQEMCELGSVLKKHNCSKYSSNTGSPMTRKKIYKYSIRIQSNLILNFHLLFNDKT